MRFSCSDHLAPKTNHFMPKTCDHHWAKKFPFYPTRNGKNHQKIRSRRRAFDLTGPSSVRPIEDPRSIRSILARSGQSTADSTVIDHAPLFPNSLDSPLVQQTLSAGRELMLECVTPNLGRPQANLWLWFRNDQPIEFTMIDQQQQQQQRHSQAQTQTVTNYEMDPPGVLDNAKLVDGISSSTHSNSIRAGRDLSPSASLSLRASSSSSRNKMLMERRKRNGNQFESEIGQEPQIGAPNPSSSGASSQQTNLINSGRYLYIPSIQLAHKGNYSCVAVNRLGSELQHSSDGGSNTNSLAREEYQLRVSLAPSFIQSLARQVFWPEFSSKQSGIPSGSLESRHLEMVCHVQCEPICHIEWLKNGQPIDLFSSNRRFTDSDDGSLDDLVSHQVENTIIGENADTNKFRSIESKLVLKFFEPLMDNDGKLQQSRGRVEKRQQQQRATTKTDASELRRLLSGTNYTCQSGPNSVGPAVKSTTKLIVQCE